MRNTDAALSVELFQDIEDLSSTNRIHGAALYWYEYLIRKTERFREQRGKPARQVDDDVGLFAVQVLDLTFNRIGVDIPYHVKSGRRSSQTMPAADPLLWMNGQ